MLFLQYLLTGVLSATSIVSASPVRHSDDSIVDWGRLSSILDSIDTRTLHNVLHNLAPRFKEGVFSKDRAAIEHVHSVNPIMASKLVYMAKRQNNTTSAIVAVGAGSSSTVAVGASSSSRAAADSTSSSRAAAESSSSSRAAAAAASTTATHSVDSSVSAALSSQIYATNTAVPAPTTIVVAPSTPAGATAVSTVSGAVVFSTTNGGLITRTSSAVSVSFTKSTSTHLYYTTLPDGSVQTSTSLIIVNAPITDSPSVTNAVAASSTLAAGLQTNIARPGRAVGGSGAAVLGLLGFVFAL